jgi:hypothetical protein
LFENEITSKKYLLGNARWAAFGPRGHGGEKTIEKTSGNRSHRSIESLPFPSGRFFAQIYGQNAPQPQMTLQGMSPQELQLSKLFEIFHSYAQNWRSM